MSLKNTTTGKITDQYGFSRLNQIPPGRYHLIITAIGYSNLEKEIQVISNLNKTLKLFLRPIEKKL
ncbi:carboxypeptidase-like regulatory domain-containing protein [Sphingobacterium sp. SG20118]|uniref:carboxypeptidase-like regulatory domain-containing protein n=1 Tax=Sphingobacterium TaxID=28453 RepID=UPI0037DFC6D0